MNDFDKLYNEYYGDNEGEKPKTPLSNELNKMINLIERLNNHTDFSNEDNPEEELGKPTSTRIIEQGGFKFVESTWQTKFGALIKIVPLEDDNFPSDDDENWRDIEDLEEKTPEELLKIAVKEEDYEEAAKLRDIIFKDNEKINENKETAENLNNKGLPEDDDWNF